MAGMKPEIAIRPDRPRAASRPWAMSGMTALVTTTAQPPARPCRNRTAIRKEIVGATAQATDAASATTEETRMAGLRPVPSEIAPKTRLPSAIPSMNPEMVSWAEEGDVDNWVASSGMPGKYMSMPSGPAAVSRASASRRPPESFCTSVG